MDLGAQSLKSALLSILIMKPLPMAHLTSPIAVLHFTNVCVRWSRVDSCNRHALSSHRGIVQDKEKLAKQQQRAEMLKKMGVVSAMFSMHLLCNIHILRVAVLVSPETTCCTVHWIR